MAPLAKTPAFGSNTTVHNSIEKPMPFDPAMARLLQEYATVPIGQKQAMEIGDRAVELGKKAMENAGRYEHGNPKQAYLNAAKYFLRAIDVYEKAIRASEAGGETEAVLQAKKRGLNAELSKCAGRLALLDYFVEI